MPLLANSDKQWLQSLQQGLQQLQVSLPEAEQIRILHYTQLMMKWNQVYNLTAIREPYAILRRHILDSLTVLPWLKGSFVLDVGTGAGLPGIPLALTLPDYQFVLIDAAGKKVRFLIQAIAELKLTNVQAVQARVESFSSSQRFNTIISRASFSSLQEMMNKTKHLVDTEGQWLAMKGSYPDDELAALASSDTNCKIQVHALKVPGIDEQRHLVCIQQKALNG